MAKKKFNVKNTEFKCGWNPYTRITCATCQLDYEHPWIIKIEVSQQMFASGIVYDAGSSIDRYGNIVDREYEDEDRTVFGVKAENSLKILIVLLEHELCHAILQRHAPRRDVSSLQNNSLIDYYQKDSMHNKYFSDLASRLFGHNMIVTRVGIRRLKRSTRSIKTSAPVSEQRSTIDIMISLFISNP